ncbi:MAG: AAA family ATPase [Clostridiales bacterium]|nr:AAA family ATPase [Clostridiales bacterium]
MDLQNLYSSEAESAILASFIIDENTRHLIETLKPTDFYDPVNRKVFEAIRSLYRANRPIDLLTIHETSKVDMARLTAYEVPTSALTEHHIGILKDKAARRELMAAQQKISRLLHEDLSCVELKNEALKILDSIDAGSRQVDGSLRAVLIATFDELQRDDIAYKSGIDELDKRTGGFHKGEMTCIAARPGRGKTALALQIAQGMAWRGLTVLIVSREMSKVQLGKRMLASNARIDGFKLRSNDLDTGSWSKIKKQMDRLCNLPIVIDTESTTVPEVRARIRREKADVAIVDYLQLLRPTKKEQSREREIAEMSRELKSIALDFDMPVVTLSQLTRNAEGKRPTMADLRESGAIEQDSDCILFLHKPSNDEIGKAIEHRKLDKDFIDEVKRNGWDLLEFIVGKQRNGATGLFYLVYENKFLNFIGILE